MKASTKRFLARIATVVMALVSYCLLDALITGGMGLVAALCLLPASLFVTHSCWQLSIRRPARRSRAAARPAARPQRTKQAARPLPRPAPTLYVVNGMKKRRRAANEKPWDAA